MTWTNLLPKREAIQAMSPEQLESASRSAGEAITELAAGISGLGGILGSAGAGEFGVDDRDVANVGWMLKNLGVLMLDLVDTKDAIEWRRAESAPARKVATLRKANETKSSQ